MLGLLCCVHTFVSSFFFSFFFFLVSSVTRLRPGRHSGKNRGGIRQSDDYLMNQTIRVSVNYQRLDRDIIRWSESDSQISE
jgi:hypothetical protein